MDRSKKNAAQPLADVVADLGPAALILYDPAPEEAAGLFLLRERILLRQMGHLGFAVALGFGSDWPKDVFMAMADTEEEGEREYARYLAHKSLNDAHRTPGNLI